MAEMTQAQKIALSEIAPRLKKRMPLTARQIELLALLPDDARAKIESANLAIIQGLGDSGRRLTAEQIEWVQSKDGTWRPPETTGRTVADRVRAHHSADTDIGAVGVCQHPDIREACRLDLRRFLETYHVETCSWPFSPDHLRLIADLQRVILEGGRKAVAFPRGAGKTSICIGAAEWALLYAHRKFAVVPCATQDAAENIIASVVKDFETLDELADDFPEVSIPFRRIGGVVQRAKAQHQGGELTGILCKTDELRLPYALTDGATEYGPHCGGILYAAGLTGHLRGLFRVPRDGGRLRPDLVLLDDPQTRESAKSESQTQDRVRLINGDVMRLAGHGKSVAAMMPFTVICRGDLAEHYLGQPNWQGQRVRAVKRWPGGVEDREKMPDAIRALLEEYRDLWLGEKTRAIHPGTARAFYVAHQAEIEAGVDVFWAEMFDHDAEVSAFQHCIHLLWEDGEYSFDAEMQQEPVSDRPEVEYHLTANAVRNQIGALARGEMPEDAASVAAFIDLNYHAAAWAVVAASNAPCYSVIDYGWWTPAKGRPVWSENGAREPLETAIYHACERLVADLLAKPYGPALRAVGIDCGSRWAATVHSACKLLMARHNPPPIYAAKGFPGSGYREPSNRQTIKRRGVLADIRFMALDREQMMQWDSHAWHMVTQKGWLIPVGLPGSVCLFKPNGRMAHIQFSEEAAADVLEGTEERNGKTQATWKRTGRNEMGDVVAGAAALLSTDGVRPDGADVSAKRIREERKARSAAKKAQQTTSAAQNPAATSPAAIAAQKPQPPRPGARAYRPVPWHLRIG